MRETCSSNRLLKLWIWAEDVERRREVLVSKEVMRDADVEESSDSCETKVERVERWVRTE